MSRVARHLQEEHGDIEATLQAITASAVATLTGATDCGISLVRGRREVQPRAWTSDLPRDLDTLQGRLGQGPCIDAIWDERVVRVPDVATETRWPEFTARAASAGAGSMLCLQLFVEGDQLGAMNVYAEQPGALDDEALELAQLLASHAAIALAGAQHEDNLRAGLTHRDAIGQAKGILMERYRITSGQAFELLVRSSSVTNRKLHDVADELASTGLLPTGDR